MGLKDALRSAWVAQEQDRTDTQRFDPLVCQCCDHARSKLTDPECVCDNLDWYLLPGGSVECAAHRFARAKGLTTKRFAFIGRK